MWILDSSALNCLKFCFLPVNWTGCWILLVSSSIWLQLSKHFQFSSTSDLQSLRTKTALFLKPWRLKGENLLQTSEKSHQLLYRRSSCLLLCGPLRKITRDFQTANQEILSECRHLSSSWRCFQPDIWKSPLVAFRTQKLGYNLLHYPLLFVLQKCLLILLNAWCKYLFHIGLTLEVSWNETQPFPELTYSEDWETGLDDIGNDLTTQDRFISTYTRWPKMLKYFTVLPKALTRFLGPPRSLTSFHCGTLQVWDNSYWVDFRLLLV